MIVVADLVNVTVYKSLRHTQRGQLQVNKSRLRKYILSTGNTFFLQGILSLYREYFLCTGNTFFLQEIHSFCREYFLPIGYSQLEWRFIWICIDFSPTISQTVWTAYFLVIMLCDSCYLSSFLSSSCQNQVQEAERTCPWSALQEWNGDKEWIIGSGD